MYTYLGPNTLRVGLDAATCFGSKYFRSMIQTNNLKMVGIMAPDTVQTEVGPER